MNNLSDLTIVIVTYKTNEKILTDCIKSIDKNIKIILVENSNNFELKEKFQDLFSNLKVYCSGKNLGYSAGNNFGINKVETRYLLILNPDIICDKDYFLHIQKYLTPVCKFSLIGSTYKSEKVYKSSGLFDENNKKNYIYEYSKEIPSLKKVDWVMGCSMLLDLNKFQSKKIFDENYFLYFDEFDLCKSIKRKGEDVFVSEDLAVDHLGNSGSFATDLNNKLNAEKLRNWHWMWSTFYFYRKNYGYFFALKKTYFKVIKFLFKFFVYKILFKKNKSSIYFCRLSGLVSSMIGKKSSYRVNSLYQ